MKCWRTDCTLDATTTMPTGVELCDLHTLLLRSAYGVLPGGSGETDQTAVDSFDALVEAPA